MQDMDLSPIIEQLRRQHSDDEHVEVKASAQRLSNDVWETVSAFANTVGGLILLGIDETNDFKPVKKFAIDRVLDAFVSGIGDGDPSGVRVDPPPAYHIHRLQFEGAPVLAIEIESLETDRKPCYIRGRGVYGGSYKRIDDKDVRLSDNEIYSFKNYLKLSPADKNPVEGATKADLSSKLIDNVLNYEKDSRALRDVKTKEAKLARLNIMNSEGKVTLAGLLVCGDYPQQFFPKLVVDVAVHPGISKSEPNTPTRFLDREVCEGPIGELIDTAMQAIKRNLRTYSVIEGVGRVDELEIPEVVLREALANALVHREYSDRFSGQAVSVDIYPDRLEIINPGGLWGGKTLTNLADGSSVCRNPFLMRLMTSTPLPSGGVPVEGNGGGIQIMKNGMVSRALAEPDFEPRIDSFKVVLSRSGVEMAENRQWLSRTVDHALDSHEKSVAVIVRREGHASVASIREQLGIDSDEIRKIFRSLIDEGVLKWAGEDEVELARRQRLPRWSHEEWRERILAVTDPIEAKDVNEIAAALGRTSQNARIYIKELVASGELIATASPSSRKRRYLRNE